MSELIYGRRSVLEALRAGRRHLYRLWLEGDGLPKPGSIVADIAQAASERQTAIRPIKGGLFDKLMREQINHQGVALEVGDYPYVPLDVVRQRAHDLHEPPLLLLLDHLQDPQNLGTLLRTAEAMNVHGVIIPDRRSAHITPAVCNASSGAVEHLLVVQVNNLNRTIEELKEANIWVLGLDGAPDVQPLAQANLSGALAVVVGSEGEGLSRLARQRCDFLVRLPMHGRVESLNAAVAGSIVLYAVRQARAR
jgi:23S rRNA (guanosine2251-2'-O)-methyltransferase